MAAMKKVVVVGGGPVGALAALYVARRGHQVELYDLRDDPNFGDPSARPAIALIPLQLSERGIQAIASAGVPETIEDIIDQAIPLHTRLVHDRDQNGEPKLHHIPYGPNAEELQTLPREKVAKRLLRALQDEPTATVHFNHKLVSCDFKAKTASFERINWKQQYAPGKKPTDDRVVNDATPIDSTRTVTIPFDFIFGCDGSYSKVRQCMMRQTDVDFNNSYIGAKWCDFVISPNDNGGYRMNPENIHIWPDKESMMMAQPDVDGSFRGGMVVPTEVSNEFEQQPERVASWFRSRYPGIVPDLMSAKDVTEQFIHHHHISLGSVKCGTFGYKDSAVLLGDAAHQMTPFHAMGMITGLEDVRIFFEEFLDPANNALPASEKLSTKAFCPSGVVGRYTEHRRPDVQAMTDMAEEHYHELRIGTTSPINRGVKAVQMFLQRWVPMLGFATLYSRIQFSHERFSVIRESEDRQKKMLKLYIPGMGLAGLLAVASIFVR